MTNQLGLDLGASGIRAFAGAGSDIVHVNRAAPEGSREKETIDLVKESANQLAEESFSAVCLGMSGFSSLGVSHEQVSAAIAEQFSARVILTSDMVTAHFAHFGQGVGVASVVGTGALAFGISEKANARIDGLGATLGDLGSAHWIGLRAIQLAKREAELNGESALLRKLEESIGESELWPQKFARRELPTFEIAALSRKVSSMADGADALAVKILSEAGELAAQSAIACARKVGVETIAFGGSVLDGSQVAREAFTASIESAGLHSQPLEKSLVEGAYELAQAIDSQRANYLVEAGLAFRSGTEV